MHLYRFALMLSLGLLSGCVPLPFPHTSERFHSMQGHVVDATTGKPIPGVMVAVHDHPRTTAKTDKTGAFRFSKHRNYHYGLLPGICGTSWPEGSEWSDLLEVSHPDYEWRQVDASKQIIPSSPPSGHAKPYELRDIRLTPNSR
jgi:hypothetical protein